MSMPLWFEISIPIAIYHRYQYEMLDYGSNTARDIHFGSQVVYAVEKTSKDICVFSQVLRRHD